MARSLRPLGLAVLAALQALATEARTLRHGGPGEGSSWLELPAAVRDAAGAKTGIVTYVGTDRSAYVDSAAMLGLSVQRHVPDVQRLCIVPSDLGAESRQLLAAAGWQLIILGDGDKSSDKGTCLSATPCREFYNKLNMFRIPMELLLWLDADTLVMGDGLPALLTDLKLSEGHVGMVQDCCSPTFNSGVMLLRPNLTTYDSLRRMHIAGKQGDQDLINKHFSGRIQQLEPKYNTHGYKSMSCDGVVVAHFTGRKKPTQADARHLETVRTGEKARQPKVFNFQCADLYKQYYCLLKESAQRLSGQLQLALSQTPPC